MNERFSEKNKWVIRQPINMAYMMSIHTFVHTNIEISSCLTKKHREMFKTPWFVAWFHENEEFFRPALFREGPMRHELERFLIDMSDMMLVFGFAGYYVIKDMAKWIERNPDNYLTQLPFGIIPLRSAITSGIESRITRGVMYGTYAYYTNKYTMKEQIVFECADPHLEAHYTFGVFDNGAKFVPMYDGLAPINSATSARGDLVPVSPFAALYRRKSLIEEAIEDMYDANFNLSHPQTFVTPHHIPDSKVTDISESMYYGADTLSNARQNDSAIKQLHATQSVRWLVNRLNQQAHGTRNPAEEAGATRRDRKKAHARPDQSDGIHTIAGYVDITNTHAPSVIVNIDTAQNQYEEEVCNVIGLPYIFYRNDSGITARATGGKSAGGGHTANNEEQLNFYKTVLYDEIDAVFASLNRLFAEVYTLTYRHVDVYTLSAHYAYKEQERIQRELDAKEEGTEKKKKKEKAKEKEKKRKRDVVEEEDAVKKGCMIATVDFDERARSVLSGVHVALKYEKMVTRSTASLGVLLQCYEKGVIGPEYMKKYIHLLYGQEADLIYSQETKKGM